jgi:NDP-sugar pyrophosphorylase family protein
VNVVSAPALASLPERDVFNHLDDWLGPLAAAGGAVGGEVLSPGECIWEPVGTPEEYLEVNFRRLPLAYLEAEALAARAGVRFPPGAVLGSGARVDRSTQLDRVVVWEGEQVPGGACLHEGVFAAGAFHPCGARPAEEARG